MIDRDMTAFALIIALLVVGILLFQHKRIGLVKAMEADGFAPHEVKKAMRLHAERDIEGMERHCRAVVERLNCPMSRDWTKADSYR